MIICKKMEVEKMNERIKVKRGEVISVSFNEGNRDCIVVQNKKGNENAPTTIVIPLIKKEELKGETSYIKIKQTDVETGTYLKGDYYLIWEPRTIDKQRIIKKKGKLKHEKIIELNRLGLETLGFEKEGELRWVHLPPNLGSEQGGVRPCLVIERNGSIIAIPTTKALNAKRKIPTHVYLDKEDFENVDQSLDKKSILLWEQPAKVEKESLKDLIGTLNSEAKRRSKKAAAKSLGLYEYES